MNEILLYSQLDKECIQNYICQLSWIPENSTYATRIYCEGGDVQGSWGIAAKMNELKAKGVKSIAKVDGMAASMAGVLLAFFDEREALAVSDIMIHRASYGTNEDGSEYQPSQEEKIQLAKINNDIKTRLNQVIDNNKLKLMKGYDIEDLFNEAKPRINCWLNAEQAQEIGLITKIVPLDANTAKYKAKAILNCYEPKATAASAGNKSNLLIMTAKELKEKDPAGYEALQKEAIEAYKAEETAKAEAAKKKCSTCDPEKMDAKAIAEGVKIALAELGISKLETIDQTAIATAKLEAEKAAAKTEETKTLENLAKEIEAIKNGGKIN